MAYTTLISANALHDNLNHSDWVVLDCRFSLQDTNKGRKDYQASHIPGARYVHLDDDLSGSIIPGTTGRHPLPEVAQFVEKIQQWGIQDDSQVVAYDDMGGPYAARLWWMLKWVGHENVAVLDGGLPAWTKSGYATTEELPHFTPTSYTPTPSTDKVATTSHVLHNLDNPAVLLVDARAEQRYAGIHEPIDPVAGHIPGAASYPFKGNLTEEGYFKSAAALKERFSSFEEVPTGTEIVCYCGSGVTAAHNTLAMVHAGLPFPRMYAGSWSEWITDPNRPVGINS